MAYPNYAITRIEEYLAALADGSAAEKAILASAIEEGGLGWIEPAQVLYETDAATEEISLTAPIVELTEGASLTLSFTLGSDPAVEATATVTDVDDVLTAAFELSDSQTVTITDEAITFSTDPDGAAFSITQPAIVHMIDSDFLPAELPASTSSDEGKVLTVDSNGDPAWVEIPQRVVLSVDGGSDAPVSPYNEYVLCIPIDYLTEQPATWIKMESIRENRDRDWELLGYLITFTITNAGHMVNYFVTLQNNGTYSVRYNPQTA